MTFSELARPIFERAILDYHKADDVDTPMASRQTCIANAG